MRSQVSVARDALFARVRSGIAAGVFQAGDGRDGKLRGAGIQPSQMPGTEEDHLTQPSRRQAIEIEVG
ncbi:MAG: hypothetical protein ACOC6F_00055 [bacterium]